MIELKLGALSPSLADQLKGQSISPEDIAHFELDKMAILRASIRGYLPKQRSDEALRKLVKAIEKAAKKGKIP